MAAVALAASIGQAALSERARYAFDLAAASMLVFIGASTAYRAWKEQRPSGQPIKVEPPRVRRWPLLVGAVHGLAGSGLVSALVLGEALAPAPALAVVSLYGLGAAAAMAAVAGLLGAPLAKIVSRPRARRALMAVAGLGAVAVGVAWGVPMAIALGVAMERPLLEHFDALVTLRGVTRSELLRDLVRAEVARTQVAQGVPAVASLTLVYDHHVRDLTEKLTEMQHELGDRVTATLHVHLDHDHCLEVIILRGRSDELQRVAERLLATRGVTHGGIQIVTEARRKPQTPNALHTHDEDEAAHGHPHPPRSRRARGRSAPR
jgi:CopG family nickel-responsive transcriptional regulator